ncbi:MAG: hypothetical protein RBR47_13330, partial [Bacteroidales bacterium]|jgi:hypothetical protein|nr:hypothetical protein [Bacteroidales bacterium]
MILYVATDFSLKICFENYFSRNDKGHDVDGGGGIGREAPDPASPSLARQPCHFDRREKSIR